MGKRWLIVLVLVIMIAFFSAAAYGFEFEVKIIKSEFGRMVGGNLLYSEEYLRLIYDGIVKILEVALQGFLSESQFFVYVDRKPVGFAGKYLVVGDSSGYFKQPLFQYYLLTYTNKSDRHNKQL